MVPGGMKKSVRGMIGIAQRDKQVNDYADGGQPSKALDKIGPPLSYMEECGVFKPLDTIANPLGICRFYQTDPQKSNIIMGLKSAASTHRIKCLLELAKELGRPLTIMVFEGGTVTPLGLLQELHLHLTLLCILIHMPEEVKMGQKNCVSCYPICAYVLKNDYAFLNHIIVGHYWSSFSCGKCLEVIASSRQQMKKHFLKCCGPKEACKKLSSKGGKLPGPQGDDKSDCKPKKSKKDKADKADKAHKDDKHGAKGGKLCRSPSKSSGKTTSQEQVLGTPHHSKHLAGSMSGDGHHKKLKKCGKKSHKKSNQGHVSGH